MEIHLLGTVDLAVDGAPLTIRSHKVRILLAGLALDLGKPLSPAVLAHRVWDGEPPISVTSTLQSYVSRLRGVLREAGAGTRARPGSRVGIVSQAGTYTLRARPEQVDWYHFRTLAGRARTFADAGEDRRAWGLLREAEEVWRGEPLAGLPGEWAQSIRVLMTDRKLAVTLTRIEVELRLGRFADTVTELIALAADHPWNERVSALLMTALYGCDRRAEAFGVYHDVRRRLRADLGIGPGESLNRLNEKLLHQVPVSELVPRPAGTATGPTRAARGATPPAGAAHRAVRPSSTLRNAPELVGRDEEPTEILAAARNSSRPGGGGPDPLPVVAVSGMGGAGKTGPALALRIPEEHRRASELLRKAVLAFQSLGSVRNEIDARTAIGRFHRLSGDFVEARRQYSIAAGLARRIGAGCAEEAARDGLSRVETIIRTAGRNRGSGERV
ncbi:BTAD domain-containing putative transcriptional regulator [Kitasatospora sp. NPDC090308]|uniref:AfsR/SARP family transcriptional regulator n=1 Tax=Kitasatospora sp. NPDC090308 TaxID=3364082 RepID=UPI00382D3A3E